MQIAGFFIIPASAIYNLGVWQFAASKKELRAAFSEDCVVVLELRACIDLLSFETVNYTYSPGVKYENNTRHSV